MEKKVLFKNIDDPEQVRIDKAVSRGAYKAWEKVLKTMKPEDVIAEVKEAGVRGRGGAGFPAGVKWGFIPKGSPKPKYLVCNADESEPGTCKDRVLMEQDPHLVVEGMCIAAYAIDSHLSFIYVRGEFVKPYRTMEKAIAEAYEKGFLGKNIFGTGFDLDMIVHTGGGAYICGEETALLNSLEGERGMSRIRPPFPAIEGLYACPTIVNNVETLSCVPHVINNGAQWYKSMGTEKSPGTKIFSLSGHVNRPGNYEVELGTPLSYLVNELGGGVPEGRKLKAIIPGGSSTPFLLPNQIDTPLDYESIAAAGSMLGSGGIIVIDDRTCMVWVIERLIHFYKHESCGKCTPCREGTGWLEQIISKIEHGEGKEGDIEKIETICENIMGRTVCPLGDAAVMPIQSSIKLFRNEWEHHIKNHTCMVKSEFEFK
ncbi:MAG: NADH-quinone oxidoreductase subunit F [candidate division Zixibacteria bacterium HGW-Zixibacteria-1]|nr:MAG: NADH-quinone oxidoreductase subunit F [candidate division Zixibacteria bacterium HGW-Zixibacteria-1]